MTLLGEEFAPMHALTLGLVGARSCLACVVPSDALSPKFAQEEFARIVTAMRLHKSGNVSVNVIADWHAETSDQGTPSYLWSMVIPSFHSSYEAGPEDIGDVSILAEQLAGAEDLRFTHALRRFEASYRTELADEMLIDYWIALEALFLGKNETQELAFKAAIRIARYLANSADEGKTLFDLVKRSYSVRSKLVHGVVVEHPGEITGQTQDVLRRSLKKALQVGMPPDLDALDEQAASAGYT